MNKASRLKSFGIAAATFAVIPIVSTSVAFADTTPSSTSRSVSFTTQYQVNASQEASLWSQARSYTFTNSQIFALGNTIQTMNTQIASLYSSEQTLAGAESNLPQAQTQQWNNQLKALEQQRNELIKQAEDSWKDVNWFAHDKSRGHGHGPHGLPNHARPNGVNPPTTFAQAEAQWQAIYNQLLSVDKQIEVISQEQKIWTATPFDDALKSLQDSILKFQASVIQYTKEYISMEQSHSSPTTNLSTPTGLTVTNLTMTGWTVRWNSVSGSTGYDVYLNGQLVASNVSGTSYSFSGKAPSTTYTVAIAAVNTNTHQQSGLSYIGVTTDAAMPLSTPTIVSISNVTRNSWNVAWSSVTGAAGYNVYVNGHKVLSGYAGTSYTFTGQNPNATYTVIVTAVNSSSQESNQSQAARVTTLP